MPAVRNGIEDQLGARGGVGITDRADLPPDGQALRGAGATIVPGQGCNPGRDGRKGQVEKAGRPALVRDDRVGCAMEKDRRHRADRLAIAPWQQVGARDAPEGGNALRELAG